MKTRYRTKSTGSRPAPREQKPGTDTRNRRGLSVLKPKNILVPVDFSPESTNALKYAAALAGQHGAALTLLHVVEPVCYVHDFGYGPVKRQRPNVSAIGKAEARLRALGHRHLASVPSWEIMVCSGPVCEEIAKAARKIKGEMILMPTRGLAPTGQIHAENMAARVIRQAPCPVLTLRKPRRTQPRIAKKIMKHQ